MEKAIMVISNQAGVHFVQQRVMDGAGTP